MRLTTSCCYLIRRSLSFRGHPPLTQLFVSFGKPFRPTHSATERGRGGRTSSVFGLHDVWLLSDPWLLLDFILCGVPSPLCCVSHRGWHRLLQQARFLKNSAKHGLLSSLKLMRLPGQAHSPVMASVPDILLVIRSPNRCTSA